MEVLEEGLREVSVANLVIRNSHANSFIKPLPSNVIKDRVCVTLTHHRLLSNFAYILPIDIKAYLKHLLKLLTLHLFQNRISQTHLTKEHGLFEQHRQNLVKSLRHQLLGEGEGKFRQVSQ